jgi:hypothetical protein
MNRQTIFYLFILTLFSCQNKKRINIANELRGNTFNFILIGEKDSMTIEFKDSTCTIFDNNNLNYQWRIVSFDNQDFLVVDKRVIAIKQKDKNSFKGLLISEEDYEIIIERRFNKWNKELLNGIWIEEKYYELYFNDSLPKPPPPMPAPPGISESDFQYPPFYEIIGDTILATYYYHVTKSKMSVNNTTEFLTMSLFSDYDRVEELWKIKELNDSILIVDRTVKNLKSSLLTTTEENIKLIKKQ